MVLRFKIAAAFGYRVIITGCSTLAKTQHIAFSYLLPICYLSEGDKMFPHLSYWILYIAVDGQRVYRV